MSAGLDLATVVDDFARGMELADRRCPPASNARSGVTFRPGIGPHTETETVKLVMAELSRTTPNRYGDYALGVPYSGVARRRCDLCLGSGPNWEWAIEVKMVRFLGDNGKLNDNILMHLLSPYPEHRSALTHCDKLGAFGPQGRKGILVYGYDHEA